jgi:hypothetical protein
VPAKQLNLEHTRITIKKMDIRKDGVFFLQINQILSHLFAAILDIRAPMNNDPEI